MHDEKNVLPAPHQFTRLTPHRGPMPPERQETDAEDGRRRHFRGTQGGGPRPGSPTCPWLTAAVPSPSNPYVVVYRDT